MNWVRNTSRRETSAQALSLLHLLTPHLTDLPIALLTTAELFGSLSLSLAASISHVWLLLKMSEKNAE